MQIDRFIRVEVSTRKSLRERRIEELLRALSSGDTVAKLLLAIYSYFAEAECDFISMRTKQGMASARAQGKHVGRPKGSRDKNHTLDPYREQIRDYLQLQLPLRRIHNIVNPQLEKPLSYSAYCYFVRQDEELLALWHAQRGG